MIDERLRKIYEKEYKGHIENAHKYGYPIDENMTVEEYHEEYWVQEAGTRKGRRNLAERIAEKWCGDEGRTMKKLYEELDMTEAEFNEAMNRERSFNVMQIVALWRLLGISDEEIEYFL